MLLSRVSGKLEMVEMKSDPLGIFSSLVLQRQDLRVGPGDRFYLYSDGLIELEPGGGRKRGTEVLAEACLEHQTAPLSEAPNRIMQAVLDHHSSSAPQDDLLLLCVEVPQ